MKKKGLKNFIRLRAHKDPVINEVRKIINKMFSKTRATVEHVFGRMKKWAGEIWIRTKGLTRAKRQIKLVCMMHNIRKLECLERKYQSKKKILLKHGQK